MPRFISIDFVWNGRSRSYQRHFAFENAYKLWEFIQTGASQDLSYPSDAGILSQLVTAISVVGWMAASLPRQELFKPLLMYTRIVVRVHGPELQKYKWP